MTKTHLPSWKPFQPNTPLRQSPAVSIFAELALLRWKLDRTRSEPDAHGVRDNLRTTLSALCHGDQPLISLTSVETWLSPRKPVEFVTSRKIKLWLRGLEFLPFILHLRKTVLEGKSSICNSLGQFCPRDYGEVGLAFWKMDPFMRCLPWVSYLQISSPTEHVQMHLHPFLPFLGTFSWIRPCGCADPFFPAGPHSFHGEPDLYRWWWEAATTLQESFCNSELHLIHFVQLENALKSQ